MDSSMFKKVCCELKSSLLVQYVNEKKKTIAIVNNQKTLIPKEIMKLN